ncbi:MAG: hypothetical protein LC102_08770 [Ignavibacteriales bacterium]|jgi:hypothetical protein|nr:MAG: hypothetical protein F9K26_05075 [Ignavibacteriaceae bacterium]MBW7872785.1 hypothetical protein [Ignavibacteria bacterium]MCZ2143505.1 hypothetical protein [Ignavibacteriales bacterium]OQY78280.1 MAG: hypothetical protein B6D45_02255 [Ignavibacteriales bacterium UTCHB3]MBV6444381.1 hypothetical protein [Ignavibacteriaceae bacterium]
MNAKVKLLILSSFLISVILIGCGTKEEPKEPADSVKTTVPDTATVDTVAQDSVDAVKDSAETEPAKPKSVSVLGTWSGKLSNYSATLTISNQNGNNFTGSIVVNYRHVAKHPVSGTVDPNTGVFSMRDMDQTTSSGKYYGKVSGNGRSISGSYTENKPGGITVNFSFNK